MWQECARGVFQDETAAAARLASRRVNPQPPVRPPLASGDTTLEGILRKAIKVLKVGTVRLLPRVEANSHFGGD